VMINISPTVRIVLGMLLALLGLLVVGELTGLLPDEARAIGEERRTLANVLAFQYSAAAEHGDALSIRESMRLLVEQNPEILSIALSGTDGQPLASAGKKATPRISRSARQASAPAYLQAPVYRGSIPWGRIAVRFAPLPATGLSGFQHHRLAGVLTLLVVFPLGGFLLLSGIRYHRIASTASVPSQVRAALDALAEGVLLLDMQGRILLANAAFANSVDKKPGALLGRRVSDLKWELARTYEDEFPWDTALRLGVVQTGRQLCFICPSGATRTFMVNTAPVKDGSLYRGVIATFDDVTELEEKNNQLEEMLSMLRKSRDEIRRQNRELQVLATRDPLTNCLNRRAFFERHETVFAAALRDGQLLACLMVDIDLFKSINDRYGHVKGDEAIRRVAQTLQASLRATDTICRYGGEEFCIILRGVNLEQAVATAMRARANIASMNLSGFADNSSLRITASFGIATIDGDVADFAQFIDRADQALYISKNTGRNRVSVWDSEAGGTKPVIPAASVSAEGSGDPVQEAPADPTLPHGDHAPAEKSRRVVTGSPERGHDPLTGLPGRTLFYKRIVEALEYCREHQQYFSLVMLDLNSFGHINHTLGFSAGDELLREVGRRLASSLRSTDSVMRFDDDQPESSIYRLGGDEFGILLTGMEYAEFTAPIVKRVIASLTRRINIGDRKIALACSAGISLYPENGRDADSLLKKAAIALYHARCQGQNRHQFFNDGLVSSPPGNSALQDDLQRAIENNELQLHYQPKIDLESGRIVCMEALLRWRHPRVGIIPPAQFLPLAESTGLINAIGKWVLHTGCRQLGAWQQSGHADLSLAVNLSAVQFNQKDLLLQVSSALDEIGVAPRYLELEITEGTIMDDIDTASTTLRLLHKAGMKISVDDFGTGYSSLNHLKRFPIGAVKIDRSFIRDITTDADDAGIIKAIIAMAHGLGIRVVAEGVETEAQLAFLRNLRCDEFQGFLFSPPVPHDEADTLLMECAARDGRARLAS
jgi:diguanylate cyclase (GGDEF)-like protein/PAS domain S-box-containing protein